MACEADPVAESQAGRQVCHEKTSFTSIRIFLSSTFPDHFELLTNDYFSPPSM